MGEERRGGEGEVQVGGWEVLEEKQTNEEERYNRSKVKSLISSSEYLEMALKINVLHLLLTLQMH